MTVTECLMGIGIACKCMFVNTHEGTISNVIKINEKKKQINMTNKKIFKWSEMWNNIAAKCKNFCECDLETYVFPKANMFARYI